MLIGMNMTTASGEAKCVSFATGNQQFETAKCKSTPRGGKCDQGWHLCPKLECKDDAHSFKERHM